MATNRPRALQVFDPVLTNLARSYRSHGFIARSLLPTIPVSKLSGQYPVFTKAYWFQNDVDNKANDRAPAKEVDFEWSTETYFADTYELKTSITDLEKEQSIDVLKLEQSKAEFLTQRMELAHEVRVATLLQASADGGELASGASTTVGTAWDSTGNPEADIKAGALVIYDATGFHPNTMVIPYKVAYAMALNTNFRNILRYDAAGEKRDYIQLGEMVIPAVIHGMRVVIPDGAQLDSSNEGGTSSVTEIWGKQVRLLYCRPDANWGEPSVAYVMQHTAKRVTKWSQVDPDVDYVREQERYDLKVVAPDCGYVLKGCIS